MYDKCETLFLIKYIIFTINIELEKFIIIFGLCLEAKKHL
jgi:hypothetical protein